MREQSSSVQRLQRRFRRLVTRLGKTGWILLGTIHERRICAPAQTGRRSKNYGPYYQWTFKREGRTITVNLSASQRKVFAKAIRRERTLEKLLDEMRSISRQFLEATTQGVPKRKPRI